jgi:putative flippase GtrA
LFKFGIVGTTGLFVDFGITYLCKEKLRWNKFVANSCGFSLAVINNFLLNRFWTFNSTGAQWQVEFGKFVLFALVGLGLNNLLLYIFNNKFHIKFYVSKGFATVCVFVWNFLSNYYFTFR